MQVTDYEILTSDANTGVSMRQAINAIFGALKTNNEGSTEPLNPFAFMTWVDTSNATYYYVKERNHTNDAWITRYRYTVATKVLEVVSNGVVLNDANFVHKTGDETIAGIKNFTEAPLLNGVPLVTLAIEQTTTPILGLIWNQTDDTYKRIGKNINPLTIDGFSEFSAW